MRQLPIPDDPGESEELLAQTREVYDLEQSISLSFDGIQDIGAALERAKRQGILDGAELLAIATTLSGARQLRRVIDAQEDLPVLEALVSELRTYPELEQKIHFCIDDRGKVTDRASPKLTEIRESLRQFRDRIYSTLNKLLQRHASAIQESVITQRGDRFVIPVKAPQKDAVPGIVHDTSATGATLYVEPNSIVSLGNQFRQKWRQERVEEEAVRRRLTEQVAEVHEDLEELLAIATTLDLAAARARYSLWLEANPPRFINVTAPESDTDDGIETTTELTSINEPIVLRQLRHPLLIWQHQHEQGPDVVPINLVIQPNIRVVAITGPNTGGKTVTLKTLGLATLMAKVGLFVPAKEPVELPWFSQILADIGDEQSIEQSLSTFSGHIRRISRILAAIQGDSSSQNPAPLDQEQSDSSVSTTLESLLETPAPEIDPDISLANALILLDEVGAGTDPSEGSALAIALLKYLADHTQLTLATTHFGELKALKYDDERFENASVEFDDVSLSPTYRLLWGIPGRSNALAIARRLGLNPDVLELARNYVGMSASDDVNQVISGLESQRRQQETKAQETAKLLRQAEKLHAEVARKAQFLKQREQDLKQQQEQAIQQAIQQAKEDIAQVIRKLQRGPETAQAAQRATQAVNKIAEQQLPPPKPVPPKPGFQPQVGDRVRVPRLGQTADVVEVDGEELTVRFGLMKMTLAMTDIESLQGEKVEPPPKPKAAPAPTPEPKTAPAVRTSKNTIDIRGSRVADAEIELDRAIATADPGPIWIIHGKGTGKLRLGVHEFLKNHPQISQYDLAPQNDGGAGVTIAQVK